MDFSSNYNWWTTHVYIEQSAWLGSDIANIHVIVQPCRNFTKLQEHSETKYNVGHFTMLNRAEFNLKNEYLQFIQSLMDAVADLAFWELRIKT